MDNLGKFSLCLHKHVVTPNKNRLTETVLMTVTTCFHCVKPHLIWSSASCLSVLEQYTRKSLKIENDNLRDFLECLFCCKTISISDHFEAFLWVMSEYMFDCVVKPAYVNTY